MEILKLSTKYKARRLDKEDVDIIYNMRYPNDIFYQHVLDYCYTIGT